LRDVPPSTPPRTGVLAAALATLAVLPFCPAMGGGFIYDDNQLVANNVYVHSLRWWRRWFTTDFWDVDEQLKHFGKRLLYFRPGVTASYALDWWIGAGSPVMLHVTNLVWHAVASLLAFVTLRRWSGNAIAAFVAALVIAVHPTKAESVAWIAGRTDLLCLTGMLVATLGFARRARGQRGGLALEIVGTAFAYLTKEQAIVLPVFCAVEAWVAMGKPAWGVRTVWTTLSRSAPQLAVSCGYLAVRAIVLPMQAGRAAMPLDVWARSVALSETLGRLFVLTFAPHDPSVEHGLVRTVHGRLVHSYGYAALGAIFVLGAALAVLAFRHKRPAVSAGIAFYLLSFLPTANLLSIDRTTLISERFLYVPLLGIGLVVAAEGGAAWRWAVGIRRRAALAAFAVVACSALGAAAARRSADFADADVFWARELALHPESLTAIRYQVSRCVEQKRFWKALRYIEQGQQIAARFYGGAPATDLALRGVELMSLRVPDRDSATLVRIERFYAALLTQKDGSAELALDSAVVRIQLDTREAWLDELRPKLLGWRASILCRLGRDAEAGASARLAYDACPGCLEVGRAAALVLARGGDYERARFILSDLTRWLDPTAVAETRALLERAEGHALAARSSHGVAKVHALAMELSTLEAWGKACALLAPYEAAIVGAPDYALGFAELCFRAGESETASRVLGALLPAALVEPTEKDWTAKTGWLAEDR
jgi:hypothetical protein